MSSPRPHTTLPERVVCVEIAQPAQEVEGAGYDSCDEPQPYDEDWGVPESFLNSLPQDTSIDDPENAPPLSAPEPEAVADEAEAAPHEAEAAPADDHKPWLHSQAQGLVSVLDPSLVKQMKRFQQHQVIEVSPSDPTSTSQQQEETPQQQQHIKNAESFLSQEVQTEEETTTTLDSIVGGNVLVKEKSELLGMVGPILSPTVGPMKGSELLGMVGPVKGEHTDAVGHMLESFGSAEDYDDYYEEDEADSKSQLLMSISIKEGVLIKKERMDSPASLMLIPQVTADGASVRHRTGETMPLEDLQPHSDEYNSDTNTTTPETAPAAGASGDTVTTQEDTTVASTSADSHATEQCQDSQDTDTTSTKPVRTRRPRKPREPVRKRPCDAPGSRLLGPERPERAARQRQRRQTEKQRNRALAQQMMQDQAEQLGLMSGRDHFQRLPQLQQLQQLHQLKQLRKQGWSPPPELLSKLPDLTALGDISKFCMTCGKYFCTSHGLKDHQATMHGINVRFKCEVCDKGFYEKKHYENHIDSHSGVKNFTCEFCEKKFRSAYNLKFHQKTCKAKLGIVEDPNKRPHICPICNTGMAERRYLQEHIRITHEKSIDFPCLCGKVYPWRSSRLKHQKRCEVYKSSQRGVRDDP